MSPRACLSSWLLAVPLPPSLRFCLLHSPSCLYHSSWLPTSTRPRWFDPLPTDFLALLVSAWSQFCIFFFWELLLFRRVSCAMSASSSSSSLPRGPTSVTRHCSQDDNPVEDGSTCLDKDELQPSANQAELSLGLGSLRIDGIDILETSESIENIGETLRAPGSATRAAGALHGMPVQHEIEKPTVDGLENEEPPVARPFHKWVRSFHRKARQRPPLWGSNAGAHPRWFLGPGHDENMSRRASVNRESSSSGSSFRFVTAVRSASVSLASVSIVARSRRNNALSQCVSRTDRSSVASASGPRVSEDSAMLDKMDVVDAAATERALQRRRILEELISTEEGYIGDVRFLMNVCCTATCVPD